jgi:hypothetical protein
MVERDGEVSNVCRTCFRRPSGAMFAHTLSGESKRRLLQRKLAYVQQTDKNSLGLIVTRTRVAADFLLRRHNEGPDSSCEVRSGCVLVV